MRATRESGEPRAASGGSREEETGCRGRLIVWPLCVASWQLTKRWGQTSVSPCHIRVSHCASKGAGGRTPRLNSSGRGESGVRSRPQRAPSLPRHQALYPRAIPRVMSRGEAAFEFRNAPLSHYLGCSAADLLWSSRSRRRLRRLGEYIRLDPTSCTRRGEMANLWHAQYAQLQAERMRQMGQWGWLQAGMQQYASPTMQQYGYGYPQAPPNAPHMTPVHTPLLRTPLGTPQHGMLPQQRMPMPQQLPQRMPQVAAVQRMPLYTPLQTPLHTPQLTPTYPVNVPSGTPNSSQFPDVGANKNRIDLRKEKLKKHDSNRLQGFSGGQIDINRLEDVPDQIRSWMNANMLRVRDIMEQMDDDNSGTIDVAEFTKAIAEMGFDAPVEVINALFKSFDVDGSKTIEYSELHQLLVKSYQAKPHLPPLQMKSKGLRAKRVNKKDANLLQGLELGGSTDPDYIASEIRKRMKLEMMRVMDIFRQFDDDDSGVIDKTEFSKAIREMGCNASDKAITALFKSFDLDGSKVIEYQEMNKLLRRINKPKPPPEPEPEPEPEADEDEKWYLEASEDPPPPTLLQEMAAEAADAAVAAALALTGDDSRSQYITQDDVSVYGTSVLHSGENASGPAFSAEPMPQPMMHPPPPGYPMVPYQMGLAQPASLPAPPSQEITNAWGRPSGPYGPKLRRSSSDENRMATGYATAKRATERAGKTAIYDANFDGAAALELYARRRCVRAQRALRRSASEQAVQEVKQLKLAKAAAVRAESEHRTGRGLTRLIANSKAATETEMNELSEQFNLIIHERFVALIHRLHETPPRACSEHAPRAESWH